MEPGSMIRNKIMFNKLSFVLLLFCVFIVRCKSDPDSCNLKTCGECISFANKRCIWCTQDVFDDRRCRPVSVLETNSTWCKDKFVNPDTSMTVETNKDFGPEVQFRPQRIRIKARPGVPQKIQMSYKAYKHFPLDVYYLMDISDTMRSKMSDLQDQANNTYLVLSKYTNNVRMGIGNFVEKPGYPYFDPNVHHGEAFQNHVPLTNDMTLFKSMIADGKIVFGSNYDDPEAGLDALMQAMKCEKEVGWRKGARRIIVLCTDSTYHSQGDGKIIGAVKINDMQCHLKNNTYSEALTFDYPSVSQINEVAKAGNFRIIFAITKNTRIDKIPEEEYRRLTQQIDGAKYAELGNKSTVIRIIKEAYEELANTILITYEKSPLIDVTIDQNCKSNPKRNCEAPHDSTLTISGTVTVLSCPKDGIMTRNITLRPYGLPDALTIEIDIVCKCDCENEEEGTKGVTFTPDARVCHGVGFKQCGICKCQPGRYGGECQCSGKSTDLYDIYKCQLNNQSNTLCNGKGTCRCGVCEDCEKGYSGDFCEFHDSSCPKHNGKICSGHGRCERAQCTCEPYWTEKDCSCPLGNSSCIAPYSKDVCSGRGKCVCGTCQCSLIEGKTERYSGEFCDTCEECAEKRCKELEDYAYCNYMHRNDKAFCDGGENNSGSTVVFVNETNFNGPNLYMAKWCKKVVDKDNGTFMVFKYQYENHKLKITIQNELELPPEANIWIAVGSAIGLVLLIGILTVIVWKILVDIHDQREFKKFSDEALAAGYDVSQNPLYQDPSINFTNPVYQSN